MLCAQPRRISAVSIAERVASERGETVGQDIGYSIRLESKYDPAFDSVFATLHFHSAVVITLGCLEGTRPASRQKCICCLLDVMRSSGA